MVGITSLDAVNMMLAAIGEQPVSSLAGEGVPLVATALRKLLQVSRLVQSVGMHCNTEDNVSLEPEAVTGFVYLPNDTLDVDAHDCNSLVTVRGNRLYDNENHTFVFTAPIAVDIVYLIGFEDLPIQAQNYIATRAAREFQRETIGDTGLNKMLEEDETKAWIAFRKSEIRKQDQNMLYAYPAITGALRRGTVVGRG